MSPHEVCSKCGTESDDLRGGLCAECQSIHAATLTPESSAAEFSRTDSEQTLPDVPGGGQFGDYQLLEEVARGGMGVIYKARHVKLNRIAALKMILGGRFSSREELQRFYLEAEAAARLDHPGIVPVYEIGEVEGQPFYAMKFIEGGSLAERLPNLRPDTRRAVSLLAKVVRAVHHAHQRGILHRDLKPANILLDHDEQPRIADLGLARNTDARSQLTNTGAVLGTPSYMPPEQAEGNAVITTAADVYSLGAILYELLTGVPPCRGETAVETVMLVREGAIVAPRQRCPSVNRELELICLKCLERSPDQRYVTALALAEDLEAWLAGEPISISAPSAMAQASRWFRRNRRAAYVLFAVLTGILVTMPFALTFAAGSDFARVYDKFPADQRPWMFSLGAMPNSVNVAMGLSLVLILWPSLGFINAFVGRPASVRNALWIGLLTSMLLIAVFTVLIGWMPLLRATNGDREIETLTEALWAREGQSPTYRRRLADELYAGLDQLPEHERAEVVAARLRSDRLASAPGVLLVILFVEIVAMIPVVYGTAIGYSLLNRGHRVWVAWFRYMFAWWMAGITIVMGLDTLIDALFQPDVTVNRLAVQAVIAVASGILFWVTMRLWKKGSAVEPTPPVLSGVT